MAKYIIIISFLISIAVRLYFILIGKHVGDIHLIYMMGSTFAEGKNPYLVYDYYVYTPLVIFLERFTLLLPSIVHLPFHMVTKFWPNLADFLTALLLYKYFIRTQVKPITAALWVALFILNPISIIISSAHGQLDSVFSLFILIAIYSITLKQKYFYLSALMLGISIAIKPNPVMLIPFFITFNKTNLKAKFYYLMLTFAPLAVTLIPFLLQEPLKVIGRLVGYSGINDMGLAAIFRGIWYQINAAIDIPLVNKLLSVNKLIFFAGYITIFLIFSGFQKLSKAIVVIYLLFLTTYFGISVQYLVWLIPFAILERDKMIIPYIFFGVLAQLGFYLFLAQNILLGNLSTEASFQVKYIYLYFYGNLLFWAFCLYWLTKIISSDGRIQISRLGTLRKRGIYVSLIVFIIFFYPLIEILKQIVVLFWARI